MSLTERLDRSFYPAVQDNWDDTLLRQRVLALLRPEHSLLDLGAGAGIVTQMDFRGFAATICGVDPDPRVTSNPFLSEGRVGLGNAIPYGDNSFDLVVADNVLEHLEYPVTVFAEVARVLKPGGHFVFKTPNRWHYMPLISQSTPTWFHQMYNRMRGRSGDDTFPTFYRANSPADVTAIAHRAGLEVTALELIESRPEYLRINPLSYAVGIAYERLVNGVDALRGARILLIGTVRKPMQG